MRMIFLRACPVVTLALLCATNSSAATALELSTDHALIAANDREQVQLASNAGSGPSSSAFKAKGRDEVHGPYGSCAPGTFAALMSAKLPAHMRPGNPNQYRDCR